MAFLYYVSNNIDFYDKNQGEKYILSGMHDFHVGVENADEISSVTREIILGKYPHMIEESWRMMPELVDHALDGEDHKYRIILQVYDRAQIELDLQRDLQTGKERVYFVRNDFSCSNRVTRSEDIHIIARSLEEIVPITKKVLISKHPLFQEENWNLSFKRVHIVEGFGEKRYFINLQEAN